MSASEPEELVATRKQALVTLDKITEALLEAEYEDAQEAVGRLEDRVDELAEGGDA